MFDDIYIYIEIFLVEVFLAKLCIKSPFNSDFRKRF